MRTAVALPRLSTVEGDGVSAADALRGEVGPNGRTSRTYFYQPHPSRQSCGLAPVAPCCSIAFDEVREVVRTDTHRSAQSHDRKVSPFCGSADTPSA
jgi:hypothetical protein